MLARPSILTLPSHLSLIICCCRLSLCLSCVYAASKLEESNGQAAMPDKIIPRGIKSLAANGVVIDRDWWLKVGCVGGVVWAGGRRVGRCTGTLPKNLQLRISVEWESAAAVGQLQTPH